jgi:hypothetical protein
MNAQFLEASFWIRRFALVTALVFVILLASESIKGHAISGTWLSALAWSLVSASLFIGARYYQVRKGQACALCNDLPSERD